MEQENGFFKNLVVCMHMCMYTYCSVHYLLTGYLFIEWGISHMIVKCNGTRPGLGREGGVTVTGLVTGLSLIL